MPFSAVDGARAVTAVTVTLLIKSHEQYTRHSDKQHIEVHCSITWFTYQESLYQLVHRQGLLEYLP